MSAPTVPVRSVSSERWLVPRVFAGAGVWAAACVYLHPIGFDDVVVVLTANHFHYAGFVVPIVAGLCGRLLPGRFSAVTAVGVLAGVPLVATGITVTKLEGPKPIECVAALTMAASGVA